MDQQSEGIINDLQQRIDYLEENRRFFQNALEMVLSLADFRNNLDETGDETLFFKEATDRVEKIISLQCSSIYQVDDQSVEFTPVFCSPPHLCTRIAEEVEYLIEEGLFAWALRERKGVIAPTLSQGSALLHVIANHSGIKGVFIGLIQDDQPLPPQSSMILISIILFNLANVLESLSLYQAMKNQNQVLEKKVAERTESLNRSTQELQQTMQRLEKMARRAEQSSKAKSQFLANMSHEIRTPLNGIIGCTELMLEARSLDKCHDLANISLKEAEHLLHLINNVLDYSKIEAGHIELEQCPFQLNELVQSVITGLAPQAAAKGLGLSVDWSEDLSPAVQGDALRLRQILINLVNNAIKFTPQGSVTLSVMPAGIPTQEGRQRIYFSVIDTGIGIPPDRQKAIFQRFTQVDESTTRRFGGTGLGTTIAYQLVSLMGGELGLESSENQGSVFSFTIDLLMDSSVLDLGAEETALDQPLGMAVELSYRRGSATARILVAEDTPVNQLVLSTHLEAEGHWVEVVGNGRLAVAACQAHHFDLVMMDVQMPVMDGITATQQIMADTGIPRKPVIIALTANTDTKTRSACLAAGATVVLTKPIRRHALLAVVENCLYSTQGPEGPSNVDEIVTTGGGDPSIVPWDREVAVYEFGDVDLAYQVVWELIENVTKNIDGIRQAVAAGDLEGTRVLAHSIKGGAATVEAGPLSKAAADLEAMCKADAHHAIPRAVDQLVIEFQGLMRYVQSLSGQQTCMAAEVCEPTKSVRVH